MAEIFALILSKDDKETVAELGILVGQHISRIDGNLLIDGNQLDLHDKLQNKIIIHK